jgi:di-N-acetylchitobiase
MGARRVDRSPSFCRQLLLLLLLLLLLCAQTGTVVIADGGRGATPPPAGWRCACANRSLCQPLAATPRAREKEVFAYYEDDYGDLGMRRLLASGAVTTIAACGGADRLADEHLCLAHAAGVRVVMGCEGCDVWGDTTNCVGHTATVPYNFSNSSARAAFVRRLATANHDYGYDGVSLDIEGGISTAQGDGLTSLVAELRAALPASAQLSFYSMCLVDSPDGHGLRAYPGYQMAALEQHIDFFFLSCYGVCQSISPTPHRPGDAPGVAMSCAPLPQIQASMQVYPAAPSKIVLGLPWYAYDFVCAAGTRPTDRLCNATADFEGHFSYFGALAVLANGSTPRYNHLQATTKVQYDPTTTSPWFNFQNLTDGLVHQVWYEDPRSLGAKYRMAARLQLRGVGFYCASGSWPDRVLGTDAEDEAMWRSVSENFLDPAGM